jgi:hypothetical protein
MARRQQKRDDFVVTVHALERLEERFPELVEGLNDRQRGSLVYDEAMDALEHGRCANVPPIELAPTGRERWTASKKDALTVWVPDKMRGYVLLDVTEGMLVLTTLAGTEREKKQDEMRTPLGIPQARTR